MDDESKYDVEISTFAQLMEEIASDWGFGGKDRLMKGDGYYWINKTHITPTEVSYKTSLYKITNPLVYAKLEKFYELLQEEKHENLLYK